jgi:cyanate lyase
MEIKGLTFEQIGKEINKDEVWVAALFYGQVSLFPRSTPQVCLVLTSAEGQGHRG